MLTNKKYSGRRPLVVVAALLSLMILLPLAGCKTEVDPSTPQQEQTDGNIGNSGGGNTQQPGGDNSGNEDEVEGEKPVTYTVTFDANGGTFADSKDSSTETVESGKKATQPDDPTKEKSIFGGWYTSTDDGTTLADTAYNFEEPVTKDITLYAKWGYTVTFNKNAEDATGDMAPQIFFEGVEQKLTANGFSRSGYVFIGWAKDPGGAVKYNDGEKIIVTTDTTLYAVWDKEYLRFSATAAQTLTIKAVRNMTIPDSMEYSVNGGAWKTPVLNEPISFGGTDGDLRLRAKSSIGTAQGSSDYLQFAFGNSGVEVACSGDIRSLVDHENPTTADTYDACFAALFSGCTSLTKAPELPATGLDIECYQSMFSGCTSLTEAPELPATRLASSCYYSMFYGCTSLTKAPELPATTLGMYCYSNMFFGCTSLTEAPELPATRLASRCYYSMFYGCTSLTEAPELPATTLVDYCYYNMFYGCSKINAVTMLATDVGASIPFSSWLHNTATQGTLTVATDEVRSQFAADTYSMPEGWTVKVKE